MVSGVSAKVQIEGVFVASQAALVLKNPSVNAEDIGDVGSIPWVGKIPWRRAWQPTPVFLPGESHGQRSVSDYNPWSCKE